MSHASHSKYRKAARLYFSGHSKKDSMVKSGCQSEATALKKAAMTFNSNQVIQEELARLEQIEYDKLAMSKAEKLEQSANLMRGLYDKLNGQLENPDGEIDNKAVDSYVKLGKRDDQIQGHQIQAETNPQDKADELIRSWVLGIWEKNEKEHDPKQAEVIDIDVEEE